MISFDLLFTQTVHAMKYNDLSLPPNKKVQFYSELLHISQEDTQNLIDFSSEMNIHFDIVIELLRVETGGTFNHKAIGPETRFGHAYGIAQFMENTAPWVAEMYHLPYQKKEDLFHAPLSIQLAICYLHYLYYGGIGHEGYYNWHKTLTAYNRGMTGLKHYINNNGSPVSSYSKNILKGKY